MVDDKTFGARLHSARKAMRPKMSLARLGEIIGVSATAVQKWERGGMPESNKLNKIADALEVSTQFLLTGVHDDEQNVSAVRGRVVPRVSAREIISGDFGSYRASVQARYPCGPNSFSMSVWDSSNEPVLQKGDEIVVDPDEQPEPGGMVVAVTLPDQVVVIGRYSEVLVDGKIVIGLQRVNAHWAKITIADTDDGRIVGVITEHHRPGSRL